MAKFRYNHRHVKHLVLQGDKDKAPYAHFQDGKFETDDQKVIDRLKDYPGVQEVESFDAPADESASE